MYFNGCLPIETASEKTKIPKQNEITSTNSNQVFIDQNPDFHQFSRYNWNSRQQTRERTYIGAHKGREYEA